MPFKALENLRELPLMRTSYGADLRKGPPPCDEQSHLLLRQSLEFERMDSSQCGTELVRVERGILKQDRRYIRTMTPICLLSGCLVCVETVSVLCLSGCRAAVQTPPSSTVSRLLLSITDLSSVIIKHSIAPELKCTMDTAV